MEHLNAIVHKELKDIAVNGPREADFNKVKEFMNKKYSENIKQNSYWLGMLDTYYYYGEDNHSDYLATLNAITMDDVKEFVKELLAQENEIVVVMMPQQVEE
jgi:zinc protease